MANPHTNKANAYARDVVKGRKPAGKMVVQACQRHLDDLETAKKNPKSAYYFDREAGNRACSFLSLLPHVKGRWAAKRENVVLEPWQCFIIANIFGWKRRKDGLRRYREAYIEVPRKSGKSFLAAGVGLYCFLADGEYGAEVYAGATSERQAWEVFRPARQMAQRTKEMTDHFGIDVNAKSLVRPFDGARFEPLIGNPGDGASPSCAIIDEFHEHQNPNLYDTMITGMGAREQALCFIITTAGSNIGGPCHEKRTEAIKMLDGVEDDDRLFAAIYSIDSEDEWCTKEGMAKANPNLGVSISEDFLEAQVAAALRSPTKQAAVKTKHFNCWVGARDAWLNMEVWHAAADPSLKMEDFKDCPAVLAIDLATKIDLAAMSLMFHKEIGGKTHYFNFPIFYLPEEGLSAAKNAQRYIGWAKSGVINLIEGEEVDFNRIQADVIALCGEYQIDEVAYDPWQATMLAQNLAEEGITVVELRNTVGNMSPAMKEVEAALMSGRFHHDGNPCLTWCASNVTAKMDAKDNIFPRKEVQDNKIDGMVAAIMAMARAFFAEDGRSAYETEELMVI